ncbi:hypothetical protein PRUPE_8G014500 [Prunus persica]|uniref:Uncharacterized protein n=1 Tax=Prunus persica TaxID=3760 RepID=A0A251MR65_PRUPE|nr:hypothetical protein PRUPE_8G014500 [Prunus persica]
MKANEVSLASTSSNDVVHQWSLVWWKSPEMERFFLSKGNKPGFVNLHSTISKLPRCVHSYQVRSRPFV